MSIPKNYWILTSAQHEMLVDSWCAQFKRDLMAQFKKGASKKGELNLFTDERDFGLIPQGSEPYFEMVDVINYAGIFGVEKKRRHDSLR